MGVNEFPLWHFYHALAENLSFPLFLELVIQGFSLHRLYPLEILI